MSELVNVFYEADCDFDECNRTTSFINCCNVIISSLPLQEEWDQPLNTDVCQLFPELYDSLQNETKENDGLVKVKERKKRKKQKTLKEGDLQPRNQK